MVKFNYILHNVLRNIEKLVLSILKHLQLRIRILVLMIFFSVYRFEIIFYGRQISIPNAKGKKKGSRTLWLRVDLAKCNISWFWFQLLLRTQSVLAVERLSLMKAIKRRWVIPALHQCTRLLITTNFPPHRLLHFSKRKVQPASSLQPQAMLFINKVNSRLSQEWAPL